ncbi:unnamed protein product [Discula destructiva]
MANTEKQGKAARAPERAASLQRMLEIERKQKMERMQLQNPNSAPAPGRRGVSPASQTSSTSSSRASGLLHRRRDSSQTRQQQPDDRRMSTVRNFTLPPLSIHTQAKQRVSLMPDLSTANLSEPRIQPQREPRKADRHTLPSMVRASTAGLEPSNLKTVAFAGDDGNDTETSSICHSPTWDDFGKKKKKKEKKDLDVKRKRLTKEPPPMAVESRPSMNPRAATDTTLSIQQLRQSLESGHPSQQLPGASTETSLPLPVVESVPRSPGFIGGVRLEREREAALKRMMNSRGSSVERPASELIIRSPDLESQSNVTHGNRRDAVPAVSYPPTSSKSRPSGRSRRNSIGQGLRIAAGKLFNSKDKDTKDRADSRASVETTSSKLDFLAPDRGRKLSGSTITHSRGQSYDSHDRFATNKEQRPRGPPEAWRNTQKKPRTTSMIAVPPNSARDGSFPPFHSPQLKEDNFDFLDRPFSPSTTPPVSPPASVSASVHSKMSPSLNPTSAASPTVLPNKGLKEAIKAGFRSGAVTPEANSGRRRSGTLDTLVGSDVEVTTPRRDSHPLQAHPVAATGSPALSAQGARRSEDQHNGQPHQADSKDSGDSSTSSRPESESLPPSPMTTPEGSRPQSKRECQPFRLDEIKRPPPLSYENVIAMRGSPTLPPKTSSGYYLPKKAESPRVNVEKPSGGPKDLVGRQQGRSGSNFKEDLPPSQGFLTDELWSQTRKPLDPDQLSFTSALTSLDVKKSFTDLDSTLQAPNDDVTPLSLEDASRGMAKKAGPDASPTPTGFQFNLSNISSPANSSSSVPNQAGSPRFHGRLPANETSQRGPNKTDSPNFSAQPVRKASDYLEEARKAAPSSPRAPASITSPRISLPNTNNTTTDAVPGARAFALSTFKQQSITTTTPTTAGHPSHKLQQQVQPRLSAAIAADSPLGAPISKMLVECCHCKFYHDMPSRVYGAMAQPDDIVKDKRLGVSGQVTMCVKCPWCAHNMSTVCCAGYAAVVYLREKLHGP